LQCSFTQLRNQCNQTIKQLQAINQVKLKFEFSNSMLHQLCFAAKSLF